MQHVDFTSEAFSRDPGEAVARLRAAGPVVATKFPIVGKVWVTTTYETTAHVLKDSSVFTLRKEGGALAGPALVDAGLDRGHCQQHADDGRAGPHAAARTSSTKRSAAARCSTWSRAFAPSPTASPTNCSRTAAPADLVAALCANAAARGDLRAARPAAGRPAEIHRLGQLARRTSPTPSAFCA